MSLSFARVRRMETWRRTAGLCASVLVHAGLAAYLLQSTGAPTASQQSTGPEGASGFMTVSLQKALPTAEPAAPRVLDAPSPASSPRSAQRYVAASATPSGSMGEVSDNRRAGRSVPPGAEPGSASPISSHAENVEAALGSDYRRELQDHIKPFQRYPDDADRAAIRGVVELSFEIDRHGRLLGARVSRTSGSASLDEAALSALRRAAPMPPIPAALPDALSVDLPVEFLGTG